MINFLLIISELITTSSLHFITLHTSIELEVFTVPCITFFPVPYAFWYALTALKIYNGRRNVLVVEDVLIPMVPIAMVPKMDPMQYNIASYHF